MKLARPLRVTLWCIIVGGILTAPLLIVRFVFRSSPVKKHVFAWSIWGLGCRVLDVCRRGCIRVGVFGPHFVA